MDFWGYLYADLIAAAEDMQSEDIAAWRELNHAAMWAGYVFEDMRDFGAYDNIVSTSLRGYAHSRDVMASDLARAIIEEAQKNARQDVVNSFN